jgi:hypothetical protein
MPRSYQEKDITRQVFWGAMAILALLAAIGTAGAYLVW